MEAADCQALGEDIVQCMEDLLADLIIIDVSFVQEYSGFNFRVTVERND